MVSKHLDAERHGFFIMEEIWKDIKGYEGLYQVSDKGRVKSLDRIGEKHGRHSNVKLKGVILRAGLSGYPGKQYYMVNLTKDYIRKSTKVHRLVALNFIPNPENKTDINHKDCDKLNNNLENLEWCTPSENMQHAYDMGVKKKMIGTNNSCSKKVLDLSNGVYYDSAKEAAYYNNIIYSSLKSRLNRYNKKNEKFIYV